MVDWILDKIREAGIDDVHLVTNGRFAEDFARWAAATGVHVHDDGTTTNETRLGAIGDIRFVQERTDLDDDLLVVAGDNLFDYSLADYIAFWSEKRDASAVAVYDVGDRELAKQYGIVDVDADDRIVGFVEKPADPPSTLERHRDVSLRTRATLRSSARTSTRATRPTSPGSSSAGCTRASRSTPIGSPAAGTTSATRRSSSRPTTGCGPAPGFPFAMRISSTRVPPVTSTELRAEDIRWDLTDLCSGAEEARTEWTALVERAQELAVALPRRDRVRSTRPAFRALLDEADDLEQDLSRLQVYSYLRLSMAATEVEANDLATFSRDRAAEIENALVFLGLEWIALDDDKADAILSSPEIAPYEHKLRVERDEKPYVLSELEEQALNARRPTVSAWQALHDRHVSTLEVPFDAGEGVTPHTISQLLSYLYRPDRDIRLRAVTALFEGLAPRADVLAAAYDALVGDRLSIDRLRGYTNPMQPTNM